ncbi:Hsp20/alpha crystallin family protein [Pseudonocardia asaccharolytica]|uniref:Heat-shock protein n=1 Tax=Pseudonocardia asaccharolytica DSM 44247 = NBRC 16224 TaxID=1123024 RepID=A0A511D028_9PSEU|nr:Hsp20/alpha crystallin family protein [Pseudonocardia asaccharolytica]GEL18136.1 heat-shock protein [Pseudonocardia asaccharolytica DSM 44247 = NBRC 16224]
MSSVMRRDRGSDLANRFNRMDRMFDDWMRSLSVRRPFGLSWEWPGEDLIGVDVFRDGKTQVIRAELPGVDPEKDVEITVSDGMLRINAERRMEDKVEEDGYLRRELRYGSLSRTIPLPDGVAEPDIKATYENGILEIRVPEPEQVEREPAKIQITKG